MMGVLLNEILDMSFKAIWLILTVIFVRILFQKLPKYIRCILWALVAIRLVCPFSIESAFSLVPLVTYTQDEVSDNSSDSKVELLDANSVVPENNSQVDEISEQENYIAEDDGSANKTDDIEGTNNNIANTDVVTENIYSIIWLFGMLAIFTHSVISYIRLKRRIGTGTNYDDIIWICDAVETPFIIGFIKPRIYLPSNMDGEIKKYVLAHEYAHIRRKDHIWKPLGFLIVCIHWFNPLVWVAYVLFSRDIEMACDEKVIKNYDVEERKAYSKALLACSASNRPITDCPVAFGEIAVKSRVKSVLNYKKPAFWSILVAILCCMLLTICFLTNPKSNKNYNGIDYDEMAILEQGFYYNTVSDIYRPITSRSMITYTNYIYKINKGSLYYTPYYSEHSEWTSMGDIVEIELTKKNFDNLIDSSGMISYKDIVHGEQMIPRSAKGLREENVHAWTIGGDFGNYILMEQVSGGVYLVECKLENGEPVEISRIILLGKMPAEEI